MTARMAVGIATGAASPPQRRKDYSAGTSTTLTAQRHELQALHRYALVSPAMPAIWIAMVMGLAANNKMINIRDICDIAPRSPNARKATFVSTALADKGDIQDTSLGPRNPPFIRAANYGVTRADC